jgi:hypothetical protein
MKHVQYEGVGFRFKRLPKAFLDTAQAFEVFEAPESQVLSPAANGGESTA